jgi:hypothetical protein
MGHIVLDPALKVIVHQGFEALKIMNIGSPRPIISPRPIRLSVLVFEPLDLNGIMLFRLTVIFSQKLGSLEPGCKRFAGQCEIDFNLHFICNPLQPKDVLEFRRPR